MIEFIRNDGQYHPAVRWVFPLTGTPLEASYHGSGIVALTQGMTEIRYLGPEADNPAAETDDSAPMHLSLARCEQISGGMCAAASCSEIVVEEGTAAAAYLGITGGVL